MKQKRIVSMIGALIIMISAVVLITGCPQPNSNQGNTSNNGGSSTVTEKYRFENKSSFTVKFYAGSSMGTLSPYPALDYWCTCDLAKGTSSDDVRCEPADKVWVISTGYNTFTFVDK